ncbi:MAG: hypothetical protein GQ531_05190 [Sulfurovum sp.]|nr:hypothetical protein [Sulfurovum sp.]
MFQHFFKLFLISFLFVGCAVKVPMPQEKEINTLAQELHHLDRHNTYAESLTLSQDIFSQTTRLTKDFEVTSPPQYHNFLVNIGMKEKGLCYHWSDALYVHLKSKNYKGFEFHLLGANIGEYWKEHNVLVVVAKGQSWKEGVILDPWRDSGKLYFAKVTKDTKYAWKHRVERGCF